MQSTIIRPCTPAIVATLLAMLLAGTARAKEPVPVRSRIANAVVYADRAEVTREGAVSLEAGRHVLVFEELPRGIAPGSVRIQGSGDARLSDIRVERKHLTESADPRLVELQRTLTSLQDSLGRIEDKAAQVAGEKKFVENIATRLTTPGTTEHAEPPVLDPEKWMKMVAFYREKNKELDREGREAEQAKRELTKRIDQVQREINELSGASGRLQHRVLATLTASSPGSVNLQLVYVVHGPQWTPLYDIRVDSEQKQLTLVYKARITQNTGEDWRKATVKLSTAQPQVGGRPPELSPWYVSLRRPPAPPSPQPAREMSRARALSKRSRAVPEAEMAEDTFAGAPLDVAVSRVHSKAASVLFVPEGTTTVLSDNQPSVVTVARFDLPVQLQYSTVPRLSPHAFLKAEAENTSDFPLLPGETNVFLDETFVTNSALELVSPEEAFETFLGIDNALEIEHKLLKKYEKKETMLTRKKEVVYEYLTTIKNNKGSKQEIVVWDQIPISRNEQIAVELIEPKYKQDSEKLKMTEENFLQWRLELNPGEEIELPFSFSVTYPAERKVEGL